MAIETTCPACGRSLRFPVDTVGKTRQCYHCRENLVVPPADPPAGVGDVRLQIERGVVTPAKTTFRGVVNEQFIQWTLGFGLVIGLVCFFVARGRLDPYYYGPIDFWDYAAVLGYVIVAAGIFSGGFAIVYYEYFREAVALQRSLATEIAASARRRAELHFEALRSLPPLVDAANQHLDEATHQFSENAFGPFWDSIQAAVRALDAFRQTANKAWTEHHEYRDTLMGSSHTFPLLPNYGNRLPDPLPALQRLEQIVRLGQTNFQFATIWEQRRTRDAIMVGFDTWADAVSQIAA